MQFANRARSYDPDADEVLHHDLFVDLLHAAITRRGGTYVEMARRTGYSTRYLKYIRDKERPVPPAATLERIIGALPHLTEREARSLREFARRATPRAAPPGTTRLVVDPAEVAAELRRLLEANHRMTHAQVLELSRQGFREIQAGTTRALGRVRNLLVDPGTSAHLAILLCNVLNVVDDPGEALKAARIAQLVLEMYAERTERRDQHLDALRVESLRAEGMTLHNLGQDRAALDRYERAEAALAAYPRDPQRTYIALDRICALIDTRRFRIGEVKTLAEEADRACDQGRFSDLEAPLVILQSRRKLAHAYVRHGDLKPRTERLVLGSLERVKDVAFAGPIHRVQLYGTAADFAWARGDRRGWEDFLDTGLRTATAAGLEHQAHKLERLLAGPPPGRGCTAL
ncbi:MAG: hypothetical protein QOF01_2674 [Thermomicrobiales bacterium]|nr:hypothetical protein [Thermomicrobiales bacterium]